MSRGAVRGSLQPTMPVHLTLEDGTPYRAGVQQLPANGAYYDRSGSIAAGGTAQQVAAANPQRVGLTFQNTSDTLMRLTENGTPASATSGYSVAAGVAVNVSTADAVSVFCATTGKTFSATEY
jgi:hypothetical protein